MSAAICSHHAHDSVVYLSRFVSSFIIITGAWEWDQPEWNQAPKPAPKWGNVGGWPTPHVTSSSSLDVSAAVQIVEEIEEEVVEEMIEEMIEEIAGGSDNPPPPPPPPPPAPEPIVAAIETSSGDSSYRKKSLVL